jgi:GcrA cell cycle regulator
MRWTAEAVEDLKRLALEGRSASVIAAAVGAASRNAVIGKANRIGIKLMGGGPASGLRNARARADRAQWAMHHAQSDGVRPRPSRALGVVPGSARGDREAREAAWAFHEAEVGEMRRVRFEEIREFACRWPLGDPKAGEFAYCGLSAMRGQSYCAGHCRMAYRAPEARARRSAHDEPGRRALAGSWRLA